MKPNITALAYDKRGRLLSVGRNSYVKTHPLQAKFARQAGTPDKIYLHAEIDALIKAGTRVHRLVVIRKDKYGRDMLAKPCSCCQLALKFFGVNQVEHT